MYKRASKRTGANPLYGWNTRKQSEPKGSHASDRTIPLNEYVGSRRSEKQVRFENELEASKAAPLELVNHPNIPKAASNSTNSKLNRDRRLEEKFRRRAKKTAFQKQKRQKKALERKFVALERFIPRRALQEMQKSDHLSPSQRAEMFNEVAKSLSMTVTFSSSDFEDSTSK